MTQQHETRECHAAASEVSAPFTSTHQVPVVCSCGCTYVGVCHGQQCVPGEVGWSTQSSPCWRGLLPHHGSSETSSIQRSVRVEGAACSVASGGGSSIGCCGLALLLLLHQGTELLHSLPGMNCCEVTVTVAAHGALGVAARDAGSCAVRLGCSLGLWLCLGCRCLLGLGSCGLGSCGGISGREGAKRARHVSRTPRDAAAVNEQLLQFADRGL